METKLISVVIGKDMYDQVKTYCFNNGVKIKEFIADAIQSELIERVPYVKKSTKR